MDKSYLLSLLKPDEQLCPYTGRAGRTRHELHCYLQARLTQEDQFDHDLVYHVLSARRVGQKDLAQAFVSAAQQYAQEIGEKSKQQYRDTLLHALRETIRKGDIETAGFILSVTMPEDQTQPPTWRDIAQDAWRHSRNLVRDFRYLNARENREALQDVTDTLRRVRHNPRALFSETRQTIFDEAMEGFGVDSARRLRVLELASVPVLRLIAEKKPISFFNKNNAEKWNTLAQEYDQAAEKWQKVVRMPPPAFLEKQDPRFFRKSAYEFILPQLLDEGVNDGEAQCIAYQAAALFRTPQRLEAYIKKHHSADAAKPVHNLFYALKMPEGGEPNLNDWADGIMKHGPKMMRLFAFADKLPSPEKTTDGKSWSLERTSETIAKFSYKNGQDNPALAALCMEHLVTEKDFETALKIVKETPPHRKNIPDIKIDGKAFGMPGARFYRLDANDIRGLFLGKLTDCCQSVGGHGHECAVHGFTSPDAGFYVLEDKKGNIIGQTFAWTGKDGELCFDTLETLGARIPAENWVQLLKEIGQKMDAKPDLGKLTAITVGMGGDTPKSLTETFDLATKPAKPKNYSGYTEASKQVVVWSKSAARAKAVTP